VGIDEQLFARLGVAHQHKAKIRQFHLQRIEQTHGNDFVPLREMRQRFGPARHAEKIGDDKH
jgi:hypothetical protein